ncbi:hypothetical protein E2C01_090047 [Portunus trituberculatus]|uniref:Uncharacterized protein n=1 Tax=Portunus trituberculatus TaxID=210409 RepID=A0A5B7JJ79_PORTR|nr:hypothetical protein [Portunus trituberculatus]
MPPASHHPPPPQPPPRHALESTPRTPTPSCSAAPHLLQATPASQLKTQDASLSSSPICTSSVYSGVRRGFIRPAYQPPACLCRGIGVRTSYPHPAVSGTKCCAIPSRPPERLQVCGGGGLKSVAGSDLARMFIDVRVSLK